MKYTDLNRNLYLYELWHDDHCVFRTPNYEDALTQALRSVKCGEKNCFILHQKIDQFDITTAEQLQMEIDKDILTFQVDDLEYVNDLAPSEYLKELIRLMHKFEIASFKLDLKDFSLKEGVQFANKR